VANKRNNKDEVYFMSRYCITFGFRVTHSPFTKVNISLHVVDTTCALLRWVAATWALPYTVCSSNTYTRLLNTEMPKLTLTFCEVFI
jgi:hypothetical protein